MERREFMTTLGAAAAVLSAIPAMAEEAASGVHHMHPPKYKALSDAAGKCALEGDNCLRHCFGMLSMNDSSMAGCTKASFDLVAACRALADARRSQFYLHAGAGEDGRRCVHRVQEGV